MPTQSSYIPRACILAFCALLLLIIIAYIPALQSGFVNIDDHLHVTQNSHVLQGLTLKSIIWAFSSAHAGYWIPLTWISHMLDVSLFGTDAAGHHAVNVFWHACNTLLLFYTLLALLGWKKEGNNNQNSSIPWSCFAVCVLFALHPLHVESVAWITERKDVLSTFFWLLSTRTYVWYCQSPNPKRMAIVCLCVLCGMMAKPMLVTLPVTLLLLDYWPLKRKLGYMRLLGEKIPLLCLSLVFGLLTSYLQKDLGATAPWDQWPLWNRLSTALVGYLWYLVTLFVPVNLSPYYPLKASTAFHSWLGGAALIFGGSITAYNLRAKAPYLLMGWLWFLITLLPVSGLMQSGTQAYADRFMYVPALGLYVALVWAFVAIFGHRAAKYEFIVLGVVAATLSFLTYTQAHYWKDPITLNKRIVTMAPANLKSRAFLGETYVQEKQYNKALEQYTLCLKQNPAYVPALLGLATAYYKLNRYQEALTVLRTCVRHAPDNAKAQQLLSTCVNALKK